MSTYCNEEINPQLADNIANTIRFLSADGVQAASSGHPGTPMGCSDIATVLMTRFLRIDPADPTFLEAFPSRARAQECRILANAAAGD